jgi:hypothetical protein
MNPILITSVIAAGLCAIPCCGGQVRNDFDPAVDFSRFKTFTFVGGHDPEHSGWLDEPGMRERFKNFIGGALEARGLHEVPIDEKYNLAVRFWVARRQKQDTTVIDFGPSMTWAGYPPYWTGPWGFSYEEYVVTHYDEGTLILDLIEPATKELVWRTFLKQKIEDRAKAYVEAKKNLYKTMEVLPPSATEKKKMQREREKLAAKYE